MPLDPYAELGVPRDADDETIKRAHRSKVKKTHPDAGGDPDAFDRVQRSYLVLSDPEARERYHQTGQTENDLAGALNLMVMEAIRNMIEMIFAEDLDFAHLDVNDLLLQQLAEARRIVVVRKGEFERDRTKLAKIRKRFEPKGNDADANALLRAAFDGKDQSLAKELDVIKETLDLNARVTAVFRAFAYKVDAAYAPLSGSQTINWGRGTTFFGDTRSG